MVQPRTLGRRLEDFSHLFLSAKPQSTRYRPAFGPDGEIGPGPIPLPPLYITGAHKSQEQTLLTAWLAAALAKRGKKVLVFDGDLSLPRLCMLMDIAGHNSVLSFLSRKNTGQDRPKMDYGDGIELVTLDVCPIELGRLDRGQRSAVADWLKSAAAQADILLVNAPLGLLGKIGFKTGNALVVLAPQPIEALVGAYGLIKTIFRADGDAWVGLVGAAAPRQTEALFTKMDRIVDKFLGKPLHNCGYFTPAVEPAESVMGRQWPVLDALGAAGVLVPQAGELSTTRAGLACFAEGLCRLH